MGQDEVDSWDRIVDDIIHCTKCPLYRYRKNPVPGEGDLNAPVMFVGEAPGRTEDETGRPFVGSAGQYLTQLLESIGLSREKVFITNVVKCRPPNNRDPTDEEIEACSPYLIRQIKLIKPKAIIALGRHSGRFLYSLAGLEWTSMTQEHGRVRSVEILGLRIKLVATYHPASALYNPGLREKIEKDFKTVIKQVVDEAFGREAAGLLKYLGKGRGSE
ncbi:type-4 uracil-DNA glycosylase [Thermogladius sp. 4427co]|uniref:type-4 uracil-DNA glycosylase n=1 Tax=Thermogladius sp. 4427co TaxID=3450718 RepID=UPI003F7B10E9